MPKVLGSSAEITPLPTVEGGFQTILAGPPWWFTSRTGKVAPEHRHLSRYGVMSLEEIRELPVGDMTAMNAHLYLRVPNALPPEGLEVMQTQRLRYALNVVWAKRCKDGGPDGHGVGFYFRNITEPILFGIKGSMRTLTPGRSAVSTIETRKREHSRRLDEQYDLIESCSPNSYLEIFARYARPGWSVQGNESDEDITPQGKAQRGYGSGDIESLPHLEPDERMSDWLSGRVTQIMADEYVKGMSVQQISTQSGYSTTRVRRLLARAGVEL